MMSSANFTLKCVICSNYVFDSRMLRHSRGNVWERTILVLFLLVGSGFEMQSKC
jgi:hypothetical protein